MDWFPENNIELENLAVRDWSDISLEPIICASRK
jgi:hypothetical protein